MSRPSDHTYTQSVKINARKKLLTHAVTSLTSDRTDSAIVTSDEFEQTLRFATKRAMELGDPGDVSWNINGQSGDWWGFCEDRIGQKKPRDLRVLYLCGPEPLNDLEVMVELGIREQNVWAVESNKADFAEAAQELADRGVGVHLHHGNLANFFEMVGERFDIVYYDACAPLPGGKPNTLPALLEMFEKDRLEPLSCLVTNFSGPLEEGDDNGLLSLVGHYLAPRGEGDFPYFLTLDNGQEPDPADTRHEPSALAPFVSANREAAYSYYLTRFLVDLGQHIIPSCRIGSNPDLLRRFFVKSTARWASVEAALHAPELSEHPTLTSLMNQLDDVGDVRLVPDLYPVLSFFLSVERDRQVARLLAPFMQRAMRGEKLPRAILPAVLLRRILEGHAALASGSTIQALQASWFDADRPYFCDRPQPHLMAQTLLGKYSRPYHWNPRRSLRLSYKAKTNRMFSDCLVFDQFRYYYDYIPSLELIPATWRSTAFQLVARVLLDRISWHDWGSSTHPFHGAALAGMGDLPSAEPYEMPERVRLD